MCITDSLCCIEKKTNTTLQINCIYSNKKNLMISKLRFAELKIKYFCNISVTCDKECYYHFEMKEGVMYPLPRNKC